MKTVIFALWTVVLLVGTTTFSRGDVGPGDPGGGGAASNKCCESAIVITPPGIQTCPIKWVTTRHSNATGGQVIDYDQPTCYASPVATHPCNHGVATERGTETKGGCIALTGFTCNSNLTGDVNIFVWVGALDCPDVATPEPGHIFAADPFNSVRGHTCNCIFSATATTALTSVNTCLGGGNTGCPTNTVQSR